MALKNSPQQEAVERRAMGNGGGAAVAMAPAQNQPPKKRNMIERKTPVLVKFTAKGEYVEGILQSVEQVEVADSEHSGQKKRAVEYVIFNQEEGQGYKMLGTYDINAKLSRADVGKFVCIVYAGENPNVTKNGRAMREFRVGVEERKAAAFADGTEVTDADIPF